MSRMSATTPSSSAPSSTDLSRAGGFHTKGGKRFPCKACGAFLEFVPGTTELRCRACGTVNDIPQSQANAVVENDFLATINHLASAAPSVEVTTIKCDACAAEVTKQAEVVSFACPYCGNNLVSQPECHSIIRPGAVLPFKVPKDQAAKLFREWVTTRWFAPNRLKRFSELKEQFSGIYVPYWTYDSRVTTQYTGQRGEYYYVTVGSGNNRRTERRVRWYPASGMVFNAFDDVLVRAGSSLPEKHLNQLEPWDLDNLVEYSDDYLSGFRAETYKTSLADGFTEAQELMQPTIDATIRADIGGDTQMITSKHSDYDAITFKHILLPVWVSAYRLGTQSFRFLVNGRTGEVQGERPYSEWKIFFAVAGGMLVIGTIVAIAMNAK